MRTSIPILILLAGCTGTVTSSEEALGGGTGIVHLPPVPARTVPSSTVPAPARPLPPGCQTSRSGTTDTLSCAVDQTSSGVPLRWTLSRIDSLSPPTRFGARTHTTEITDTVTSSGVLVMQRQRRIGPAPVGTPKADEMVLFSYGPSVKGLQSASLATVNGTVSGSINGRAVVPVAAAKGITAASIKFADGKPAPVSALDPAMSAALQALAQHPTVAAEVADSVPENGGDETRQNDLVDWETPHCQACEKGCADNWFDWLCPLCGLACEASCFLPFRGCMENHCGGLAVSSCDDDQTCCGELCCGKDEVCGSDTFGACCPKDHPVGCGDVTAVWCFPAGAQCCGYGTFACEAGTVCQTRDGLPTCCPAAQACDGACCGGKDSCQRGASGKGVCCDHALCGDECCTGGAICNAGKCGYGTPCGNQICGLGAQCCNDSCCQGTCMNGGTCCPSSQETCGNACCGAGQICANAATSSCAFPAQATLLIYNTATGALVAQSGGPPLRISDSQSLRVDGQSFVPGTVTLYVDAVGGTVIATVPVNGNAFSTTIGTWQFPAGSHKIVAGEGQLSASVDVQVEHLH